MIYNERRQDGLVFCGFATDGQRIKRISEYSKGSEIIMTLTFFSIVCIFHFAKHNQAQFMTTRLLLTDFFHLFNQHNQSIISFNIFMNYRNDLRILRLFAETVTFCLGKRNGYMKNFFVNFSII